jgi:hypothetical protein
MRKAMKRIGIIIPFLVVAGFFAGKFYAQQTCVEIPGTAEPKPESFDTTTYKDPALCSVSHWGEGYISLNKTGTKFEYSNPTNFPLWINTVASGDFDGDGWDEFVASSSSFTNVLAFVDNKGSAGQIGTFGITYWIDGSTGNSSGWPTRGVNGQTIDVEGNCGMTSGDYDGDGDLDFLFMVSNKDSGTTAERIWLYRNTLKETGTMTFVQTNLTSTFAGLVKGIAWSTTMMQSIDFHMDPQNKHIDIVMGNNEGKVLLWRNTGNKQINSSTFTIEKDSRGRAIPLITTGWGGAGVSTVSVGDMNKDGFLDIIVASVSSSELRYYRNDRSGHFTLFQTLKGGSATYDTSNPSWNLYPGSGTASLVYDFNKDGWLELMVGCDGAYYGQLSKPPWCVNNPGGMAYYFKNTGGVLKDYCLYDGRPDCWDFDLAALLDYDKNGVMDFIIADGNHAQRYYLFINVPTDFYALTGTAVSLNVTPGLNQETTSITKVRVTMDQSVIGGSSTGLSVELFVSNNDGLDWELYGTYSGSGIKYFADTAYHTFEHFGSKLKWKAELKATADPELFEEFGATSYETPRIDLIQLDYLYVERREYSRSSTVATVNPENNHELIIGATFFFPGWQGHLRAYDVTTMALQPTSYTLLQTVSEPVVESGGRNQPTGATVAWDAGELLNLRSPASRTIYTATRLDRDLANPLVRTDFTVANATTLAPFLQEKDGNNAGLIDFVRGTDRYWKLGDIDHSNPVVVGPPDRNSSLMGQEGYSAFADDKVNRTKVVYVGANDGMIHCFRVTNGEELWAFIPYNLLPRLNEMFIKNTSSVGYYFDRKPYVDGSPTVAEVYFRSDGNWHTVLICGQGRGWGSTLASGTSAQNFYFALDVTDPEDPQPLWEFTHSMTKTIGGTDHNYTLGETWSVPAIAQVNLQAGPTWVAFMGSGYDNLKIPGTLAGNGFYAVPIEPTSTGGANVQATLREPFIFDDFNTNPTPPPAGFQFANIMNAIPGSPTAFDLTQDGNVESVYFGDLDGRLYKLNTTGSDPTSWPAPLAIYTDKYHYPIITKPAVWMDTTRGSTSPRVYFGTGGDDAAPAENYYYAFISLIDDGSASPVAEWYLGQPSYMPASWPVSKDVGDLGVGEKVWADPVISDSILYFSTLRGSIESVDPCVNLSDIGRLYGRYIQSVVGVGIGGSAFKTALNTTAESMPLISKARRAVTVGERAGVSGTSKRTVYIQEYDSTVQRLEQQVGALLKIRSWREIYKIIK